MPDASLRSYRRKRDFRKTAEPGGSLATTGGALFVVQKHAARRAGVHWDFRLEHGGVLWSWAVPKGPSLDPADRRLAIHVEDHPLDYADFQGTIPAGEYGGGNVETWDRGSWQPIGDPQDGLHRGELKFTLSGQRLNGRFTLVRLRNRDARKAEAWMLIKGNDASAETGASAPVLGQDFALPKPKPSRPGSAGRPPAPGAVRGTPPADQAPQLCTSVEDPPDGEDWISEIKFDGYRLLARVEGRAVRLVTRNGHDWADRLPAVAKAVARLDVKSAVVDGELVALRPDGASSFPDLQAALSAGQDGKLSFQVFDLLALNGWDLRSCRLLDRKRVLEGLGDWTGILRFSTHVAGNADRMRQAACKMHLEGIVCKRANAAYRAGRGHDWVKVKCLGREEFVVLGWTLPAGSRTGLGALHLGYFDPVGRLHYAGGVGSGFSDRELAALRRRLDGMQALPPSGMLVAGDPLDPATSWVRPELVAEVQYTAWSGSGRVRHAVYLGLREDKAPTEVVRDAADPAAEHLGFKRPSSNRTVAAGRGRGKAAVPPERPAALIVAPASRAPAAAARIVVARPPTRATTRVGDVELTHPDRQLWPGITKRDLADYWMKVAPTALPGLAHRPLSILRCPDGIAGEQFFQKHGHGHLPSRIREGSVSGSPYLAIDDADGLVALAQMSAIELHPWGAAEADPLRPDHLVFDLDPGEDVAFAAVVRGALDVRGRLQQSGLASYCRTTGGKGLHVVVPLAPDADWNRAKAFCHAFAETLAQDAPDRYVAHVKIADRRGRVLIDWLRNGLGATAVASFSPRARPGAGVATPLAWREVTPGLDPSAFTMLTVPGRLAKLKDDPWDGFRDARQMLPELAIPGTGDAEAKSRGGASIVVARRPGPRAR